jgi:hypothetical protein
MLPHIGRAPYIWADVAHVRGRDRPVAQRPPRHGKLEVGAGERTGPSGLHVRHAIPPSAARLPVAKITGRQQTPPTAAISCRSDDPSVSALIMPLIARPWALTKHVGSCFAAGGYTATSAARVNRRTLTAASSRGAHSSARLRAVASMAPAEINTRPLNASTIPNDCQPERTHCESNLHRTASNDSG